MATSPNTGYLHADFNSDGREDFITGCANASFGLALSTADGVYATPTCYTLPTGAPAYNFTIGDFNGDGNADLIVSNYSNTFYEYLGSASGVLNLQPPLSTSNGVFGAAAADVNRDGKMDLVFVDGNLVLRTLLGNGNGMFTPGPTTPVDVLGNLSAGDFDGDGKGDLLLDQGGDGGTSYQVLYGDGKGNFAKAAAFVDDVAYSVYDLNGDGKSDLIGEPFDFSIAATDTITKCGCGMERPTALL